MSNNACPILQSGFITFPGTQLNQSDNTAQTDSILSVLKTGKLSNTATNPYFYSERVCELFNMYMSDTNLLSRFEYREMVLIEAIKLMSSNGRPLSSWFQLQNESVSVTSLHKRFLQDTLQFIEGGERTVSLENWQSMLVAPKKTITELPPPVDFRIRFVSYEPSRGGLIPHKIDEALCLWTTRSKGFRDILMFLYVVFGKRTSAGGQYGL